MSRCGVENITMEREWTTALNKQSRELDRQIRSIEREEAKVKKSLKDAAKQGHKEVCTTLAKEIVRSRKAKNRIYTSKAQINSVSMQMKNQQAMLRVNGAIQKSTDVMKAMQSLCKIPQIQETMRELSKEMMKAGIIEEMVEDTFESLDDQDELEDAAQEEVDKVLSELTAGALANVPSAVTDDLPEAMGATAMSDESDEEESEDMQRRLEALRS
ncbi:putative charged multivesicular body protein 3 isoform X3 [Apostichopus japonicus]|uniref:Putative charged multivesicular body protein 3 isoform X3 n=1 Tax=Stichopus japonicus TaxID=307972 RepID=A0A2G8JCC5_STIJA|nr:putative charged multivesicular body protein 3 isoform X3 [Apostichopus japonicus]